MERAYVPVLLLLGFVVFNAVLMLGLSALTLRARPTPVKQTAYESGIPPLGDARERFSVKFYMVAVLFIIFDIETGFMIPWGAHFRQLSCARRVIAGVCPAGQVSRFGVIELVVSIVSLLGGVIYVWCMRPLQWDGAVVQIGRR